MSLIKLPPGMTPEEFFATPEGRRAAEYQRRFNEGTQDARQTARPLPPARPLPSPSPRPVGRDRAILPGRDKDPETGEMLGTPGYPIRQSGPAAAEPPIRRHPPQTSKPGQAQPKIDPEMNATRLMDATTSDLSAALAEMFPEMGRGERHSLARQLAEEYMRDRSQARTELRPKHPTAPDTEQMEFENAYSKMSQERAREERMRKRMEQAMAEEARGPRVTRATASQAMPPTRQRNPSGRYDEPVPDWMTRKPQQ